MPITTGGGGTSGASGGGTTQIRQSQYVLCFGDSKTEVSIWPTHLCRMGEARTGQPWTFVNVGKSGASVATTVPAMAAKLAGMPVLPATIDIRVVINLGVNDNVPMPSQAEWSSNYLIIIDAIHAQYPSAPIYLMFPWGRANGGTPLACAWLPAIIAARPFLFAGPDERIWLQGADDGGIETVDGTHYTELAGMTCAAQWAAVLWP